MKQTKLALSAVMIVAVGLIGTNFITYSEMTGQEKFDALSNSNNIYGHITIVHSDPDGNILSYIQTDNVVGTVGKDCLAQLVFGNTDSDCEGTDDSKFNTIALFNGQTFRDTINATAGGNHLLTVDLEINGLEIGNGTATPTKNANAVSGGDGSKTDIEKTFTVGSKVSGQVVDGAALFNFAKDAVLAAQTFSSVTLNTDDTLKITWTIELG